MLIGAVTGEDAEKGRRGRKVGRGAGCPRSPLESGGSGRVREGAGGRVCRVCGRNVGTPEAQMPEARSHDYCDSHSRERSVQTEMHICKAADRKWEVSEIIRKKS